MTATTTARRTNVCRTRAHDTIPTHKPTVYGRAVWRVLKDMQKAGPWEFGPRLSDRIFKKS